MVRSTRSTVVDTEYGPFEVALEQADIQRGDDVLMVVRPESTEKEVAEEKARIGRELPAIVKAAGLKFN